MFIKYSQFVSWFCFWSWKHQHHAIHKMYWNKLKVNSASCWFLLYGHKMSYMPWQHTVSSTTLSKIIHVDRTSPKSQNYTNMIFYWIFTLKCYRNELASSVFACTRLTMWCVLQVMNHPWLKSTAICVYKIPISSLSCIGVFSLFVLLLSLSY